jgi:16S rRNA processing protein RimM
MGFTGEVNLILIGRLGKPVGLKGHINLIAHSDNPSGLSNYKEFFIDADGIHKFTLDKISKSGKKTLIKFDSINSSTEAEKLKNLDLFIDEDNLPDLPEGEFYWKDLIGKQVLSLNNNYNGIVKEIMHTGANDVLVCEINDKEVLIPLIKGKFVIEISEHIIVDWEID